MKKILAKITLIILLLIPVVAHSEQTVYWADNEWVCVMAGTCDATTNEYLILKEPSLDYKAPVMAHYCTSDVNDFVATKTPWMEVTFEDEYPAVDSGIHIWIRDVCPIATTYFATEIAAFGQDDTLNDNYFVKWSNPTKNEYLLVDTGKGRSAGKHKVRVGMKENGTVEYWLDDELIWSTENIPATYTYQSPESFGWIILGGQYPGATFSNFEIGTDYGPLLSTRNLDIDIRPFSEHNIILPWKWGLIPVAILSTADFHAPSEVDLETVKFGQTGEEDSLSFCQRHSRDINRDGFTDLLCFFRTYKTNFRLGDTEGILRAESNTSNAMSTMNTKNTKTVLEGRDSVEVFDKMKWRAKNWHKSQERHRF
ncbi:MAG: hypothetical protein LJE89_07570 [Deltaproteobacteria bacterium]|nr:hypothetical protein [Deltaproteobacteria bacterium]